MATWKKIIIFLVILVVIGGIVFAVVWNNKTKDGDIAENSTADAYTNKTSNQATTGNEDANFENKETGIVQEDKNFKEVEVKGTDKEKAIALAKNKWRVDDGSVSYNIVSHEGNIYNISVNSNETTEVLAWYKVNIENGEVSEY